VPDGDFKTAADAWQVMKKICLESEASLDYYALFKVRN